MYPETADLLSFVRQRAEETLRQAENVGDELRTRFAARSLAILTEGGTTFDNGASISELMTTRFLRRLAQGYRDHPDYQEEWRLDETWAPAGADARGHGSRSCRRFPQARVWVPPDLP